MFWVRIIKVTTELIIRTSRFLAESLTCQNCAAESRLVKMGAEEGAGLKYQLLDEEKV